MNFLRILRNGLLTLVLTATAVSAAEVRRTTSNLPYRFPQADPYGNTWMLYNGGRLMQQGNMPFCSDSANLTINGQGFATPNQNVVIEDGEAIIENLRGNQFSLTRRFSQGDDGVLRIIELIQNTKPQDAVANVAINFNVNFGVQNSRPLSDPRQGEKTLAMVVTDSQNRNLLSVFAGKGSKVTPTINAQQNNNMIQVMFELKVPANKQVALVHFHQTGPTPEQAEKIFAELREGRAIAGLPSELRKLIVNYPASTGFFDDLEILRGTTTDVLELTNGDQLRGDLLNAAWDMETSFGNVKIPPEQVMGLIVSGGLRPRQLIVTTDGEIIGGKLLAPTIDLQISSGQKLTVPVGQVSRMGRRTNSGETTAPTGQKPMLHLRTGDRLAVTLPKEPLKVATRFGTLALPPEMISTIDLQPENSAVHAIGLTDGSRFSGLLLSDTVEMDLARGGNVNIPLAMARKMTLAPDGEAEPVASLRLISEDTLTVALPAKLPLITTYGEVSLNGAEVKRITRVKDTLEDIQVQLWDDSTISGRLPQPYLECTLGGKATARVPVATIDQYMCSAPQPAAGIVERIRKLVAELNADDWKQRERSEAELLSMGTSILPTLNQMRADQPPEAQQRIDTIVKRLGKPAAPAATIPPRIMQPQFGR